MLLVSVSLLALQSLRLVGAEPAVSLFEQKIEEAQQQIDAKKYKEALLALQRMEVSASKPYLSRIRSRESDIFLACNLPERAAQVVLAYVVTRPDEIQADFNDAYMSVARALAAAQRLTESLAHLGILMEHGPTTTRVFAAITWAEISYDAGRPDDGDAALTFAEHYVRSLPYQDDTTKQLLAEMQNARQKLSTRRDELVLGPEYLAFRAADRARKQGESGEVYATLFKKVIDQYPTSLYVEPSLVGLAMGSLTARRNNNKWPAISTVASTTGRLGPSLYYGEYLFALGNYQFEYLLDLPAAEKSFAEVSKWVAVSRDRDVQEMTQRFAELPERVRSAATPAPAKQSQNALGQMVAARLEPGQLINQVTCPWYLDDLDQNAMEHRAILLFCLGRSEEGKAIIARLIEAMATTNVPGIAENIQHLMAIQWGLDHGYFYAFPEELANFPARVRPLVILADYYLVCERYGKARTLYQRILAGDFGPVVASAGEACRLSLATCDFWLNGEKSGYKHYAQVFEEAKGDRVRLSAAIAMGNLCGHLSDPDAIKTSQRNLEKIVKTVPESELAMQARIILARLYLDTKQLAQAKAVLRSIAEKFSGHHELATIMLKDL